MDQTNSQRSILFELDKLGKIIAEALKASHQRTGAFTYDADQCDERIAANLQKLIEAATNVHSAASSRASSKADSVADSGHEDRGWNRSTHFRMTAPGSIEDMTEDQRHRVEAYVETMREAASRAIGPPPDAPSMQPSSTLAVHHYPSITEPRLPAPLQTIEEFD